MQFSYICGIDEVGMGCLAGPVVASAVILDPKRIPKGINDSKLLSHKKREEISVEIKKMALAWSIGVASPEEIDAINILKAAHLAMTRAVEKLSIKPEVLLIDGRFTLKNQNFTQESIVKGDQKSVSIGAASILAKVYRDALMAEMDDTYPGYFFAKHKGYGSVLHRKALQEKGPCPLHRKSFSWKEV